MTAPDSIIENDVTTADAARLAKRSEQTIRDWAAAGRLPYRRLPNGWRLFARADVLRVAAASREKRV